MQTLAAFRQKKKKKTGVGVGAGGGEVIIDEAHFMHGRQIKLMNSQQMGTQ